MIDLVKALNIPVIDIHKEVFSNHPDPLALFPLRINGHYNPEGYSKVAKAIVRNVSGLKSNWYPDGVNVGKFVEIKIIDSF